MGSAVCMTDGAEGGGSLELSWPVLRDQFLFVL